MIGHRFHLITNQSKFDGTSVIQECSDDAAALLLAGLSSRDGSMRAACIEVWSSLLVARVPATRSETRLHSSYSSIFSLFTKRSLMRA